MPFHLVKWNVDSMDIWCASGLCIHTLLIHSSRTLLLVFVERVSIRATRYYFCSANMNTSFPFVILFFSSTLSLSLYLSIRHFPFCPFIHLSSNILKATNQVASLWLFGCEGLVVHSIFDDDFYINRFHLDESHTCVLFHFRFFCFFFICVTKYSSSIPFSSLILKQIPYRQKYLPNKLRSKTMMEIIAQKFCSWYENRVAFKSISNNSQLIINSTFHCTIFA